MSDRRITDYKPLRRNPNKGTQRGGGILEQSVRELGAGRSILVDKHGVIMAGNHAQEAFVNAGIENVIEVETDGNSIVVVKRTDMDADSTAGKKMAIMDNRTSEQGLAWDAIVLEEMLNEIKQDEGELDKALEKLADELDINMGELQEAPEPEIDKADELRIKWGVDLGQLWKLGEHRLICGDCTDKAVVDRVLQGEKYNVLTDPPYNIGFNYESIDDKMNNEDYKKFCVSWFNNIVPDSIGSIFSPGPKNEKYYPEPRDRGIWIKRNATAGASCFHLRLAEPLFFYGKFENKRNNDVFEYSSGFTNELAEARKKASVEENYPPAKSMPLWEELISMFLDGVILDVFIGNGTSIIACERLSRKCRAVEISPAYCAVAIERWHVMTGQEPVLLESK